jgi:DNA-binding transcriptional LysR family regulator
MSFGIAHLGQPLARFLASYPQVTVDLCLSDSRVDLVADGFDAALRIGRLADSSLIARKLCDVELLLVAGSPWLAEHGMPNHPGEIDPGQAFPYDNGRDQPVVRLTGPEGEAVLRLGGRLRANNADVMLESVAAGVGVAVVPDFVAETGLKNGRFVHILSDWRAAPTALFLLTPPGRLRPRRVTALLDFLTENLTVRTV